MKITKVARIFQKLAKENGIKIIIEPEWGYAGKLILKNGDTRLFCGTAFDLNTLGAAKIARDKDYTLFFLKKAGFPVVSSFKFYSLKRCKQIKSAQNIEKAQEMARKMSFPLILKPNNLSRGRGVITVNNKEEFLIQAKKLFRQNDILLLQKIAPGKDVRFVVLDGEVISCSDDLGKKFIDLALRVARTMNLRLCSIDTRIRGNNLVILEVNAAPGLSEELLKKVFGKL